MHDRPTALELLNAVRQFLEADVVPALEGTKKFHARVAANVLAIVAREVTTEAAQLHGEWQRLGALLGEHLDEPRDRDALKAATHAATERLSERIRRGDADSGPWRASVLAHLRQSVVDKLAVANPKYLAGEGES